MENVFSFIAGVTLLLSCQSALAQPALVPPAPPPQNPPGLVAAAASNLPEVAVELLIEEKIAEGYDGALPPDAEITILLDQQGFTGFGITDFLYDKNTGRFVVTVIDGDATQPFRLSGSARISVTALVPNRRISAGQIIQHDDLTMMKLPMALISPHMLREDIDLVGKEAKRALIANRPIQSQSVVEPRVIRKGEEVTIFYEVGDMSLTAPGRAMQDGAVGGIIRILNKSSRKSLMAEVIEAGRVEANTAAQKYLKEESE